MTAPFGAHPVLWPINLLMQIIEYIAKTVSHGMRLFGNMFAGELVFMLIALMGGVWAWQFNPLTGGFWLECRARDCGVCVGHLPHPDHYVAGVHLHDADADLRGSGTRRPLGVAFQSRDLVLLSGFVF